MGAYKTSSDTLPGGRGYLEGEGEGEGKGSRWGGGRGTVRFACRVTTCRGFDLAISRLLGTGVFITLARMDHSTYNLGAVLCDSTGATILP